jgi:hypothetical protein
VSSGGTNIFIAGYRDGSKAAEFKGRIDVDVSYVHNGLLAVYEYQNRTACL